MVIDGLDSFAARFALNSGCVAEGIPLVHGGVYGLLGEITTIIPKETACLACIFPAAPKKGSTIPVFGVTPAFIASLQVAEALKLLAGFGNLLTNRMLYFDGASMEFYFASLARNPACPVCGTPGSRG